MRVHSEGRHRVVVPTRFWCHLLVQPQTIHPLRIAMPKIMFWTCVASIVVAVVSTILLKTLGLEAAAAIGGGLGGGAGALIATKMASKDIDKG